MARRTFYDEQRRNNRASLLLVIVVSMFLFGLIYSFAYIFAPEALALVIPFSLIIIVIYTWSSYEYGDRVVLASTHARPAEGNEYVYLNNVAGAHHNGCGVRFNRILHRKSYQGRRQDDSQTEGLTG